MMSWSQLAHNSLLYSAVCGDPRKNTELNRRKQATDRFLQLINMDKKDDSIATNKMSNTSGETTGLHKKSIFRGSTSSIIPSQTKSKEIPGTHSVNMSQHKNNNSETPHHHETQNTSIKPVMARLDGVIEENRGRFHRRSGFLAETLKDINVPKKVPNLQKPTPEEVQQRERKILDIFGTDFFRIPPSTNLRLQGKKLYHKNDGRLVRKKNKFSCRERIEAPVAEVKIPEKISANELASKMSIKFEKLCRLLNELGEIGVNRNTILDAEIAEIVVSEAGMKPILIPPEFVDLEPTQFSGDSSKLTRKNPVVSIMGHVDHGKTTLLDYLRSSSVSGSEHGGITQSLGAFVVDLGKSKGDYRHITFIDTPGHDAFSSMRECSSLATDIIVLVVSAADGVQSQTVEIISLAKKIKIPVIVVITKCDVIESSQHSIITDISNQLLDFGVKAEQLGGDVQVVCASGYTGIGVNDLKDAIVVQAEIMDLRADFTAQGEAVILDSTIARGLGPSIDVLVRWGSVKTGSHIVIGIEHGRIKAMTSYDGKTLKTAGPSTPVRISGIKGVPAAGEYLFCVESESEARHIIEQRKRLIEWDTVSRASVVHSKATGIDCPFNRKSIRGKKYIKEQRRRIEEDQSRVASSLKPGEDGYIPDAVPLIIKTNAIGITSAIDTLISSLPSNFVSVKQISTSVGPVNLSDIQLAASTGATIFSFGVKCPPSIDLDASKKGVTIRKHNVIYHFLDDLKDLISEYMPQSIEEDVIGQAEILQSIPINLKGREIVKIAGCRVSKGSLKTGTSFRVLRHGEIIVDSSNAISIRHFKERVSEVVKGQECGIQLDNFSDFEIGDILQSYTRKIVKTSI